MGADISKNRAVFFLIFIVVLGFSLRLYDLSEESLWTDEMVSLRHIRQNDFKSLIISVQEGELTPPLYYIFLKYWVNVFGESEFSLRFPSLLFDFFSIVILYLLGTRLFNRKIGLISSFLLATTMLQVVYAQEARHYSCFGFLALFSTLLLLKFCTEKRSSTLFFGYIIVCAIALHINYLAVFLFLLHLIYIIYFVDSSADYSKQGIKGRFKVRSILRDYFLALSVIFLLFLPVIKVLYKQVLIRQPGLQSMLPKFGVPHLLAKLGVFFYLLPLTFVIGLLLIVVSGRMKSWIDSWSFSRRIWLTLVLLILFLAGHLMFLDMTLRSFTLIRHSFFLVPLLYLAAAWLIFVLGNPADSKNDSYMDFSKRRKYVPFAVIVVVIVVVFNIFTLSVYYKEVTKPPWNEAVNYIQGNSVDGSVGETGSLHNTMILFDRSGSNVLLFEYYLEENLGRDPDYVSINLTWDVGWTPHYIDERRLLQRLDQEDFFWLISSRNVVAGDYYKNILDEEFDLISSKEYNELTLYYYSKS